MRATCIDLATYDTQGLLIPPCPFSSLVGFLVSFFVLYPCKVPRGLQSDNGIQQLSTSPAMHYRVDFEARCIYMRACYLDTFTFHHMFNYTIVRYMYFLGNVRAIPVSGRQGWGYTPSAALGFGVRLLRRRRHPTTLHQSERSVMTPVPSSGYLKYSMSPMYLWACSFVVVAAKPDFCRRC
jgi:hypothetical protein